MCSPQIPLLTAYESEVSGDSKHACKIIVYLEGYFEKVTSGIIICFFCHTVVCSITIGTALSWI